MPPKRAKKEKDAPVKPDRKYELASFWDERYSKRKEQKKQHQCAEGCWHDGATDDFLANEWYFSYSDFQPLLQPFFRSTGKGGKGIQILDLGCGISSFFEDLAGEGYKGHWVGVDFSGEAIKQMRSTYPRSKYPTWEFLEADVRRMHTLSTKSFDLVIDKATTDALVCDAKQGKKALESTYAEVNRLLKPGGLFVIVTLYSPEKEEDRWFVELLTESFLNEPTEDDSEAPLLVPLTSPSSKTKRSTPKRSSVAATSSSSSSSTPTSTAYPYKLKITIHSSSEDNEEEHEGGENSNWMSSRYVYILQKCRTTARNPEPYSIEHQIH